MLVKNIMNMIKTRGFTLIELIMVIIIVGMIAIVVTPQWTATSLSLEYQARQLLEDVRYAQALSIVSGQRYRWVGTSSATYQITNESGVAILFPSGSSSITLTGGITISSYTNLPSSLIAFDSFGAPYTTTAIPGTALASTAVITLTAQGATRSIQIIPQTGFGIIV